MWTRICFIISISNIPAPLQNENKTERQRPMLGPMSSVGLDRVPRAKHVDRTDVTPIAIGAANDAECHKAISFGLCTALSFSHVVCHFVVFSFLRRGVDPIILWQQRVKMIISKIISITPQGKVDYFTTTKVGIQYWLWRSSPGVSFFTKITLFTCPSVPS